MSATLSLPSDVPMPPATVSMKTNIIQLGSRSLAIQHLPVAVAATVPAPVNHIIVIDISGSMAYDLGELRIQLKNKLASLVQEKDTVTIIWFSGRGQFGVVVEALEIRSVTDLSDLHQAIDRFLKPIGLTGFLEPLKEVENVIRRVSAKRPESNSSLFFMTDGYDNQWRDSEILDVCKSLESKLANAVIVEYGWCCNRPLLTKMAETLGGKLIFSADLQSYRVTFEDEISGGVGAKKVPVTLEQPVQGGFAFALVGDKVYTFAPDASNVVLVPEGLEAVAYFTSVPGVPFDTSLHQDGHLWAGLVPLAQRLDTDGVLAVLGALGDVALVETFSSCFSKEDYVRFQDEVAAAADNPDLRYAKGYDAHAVPKEDAYTVLELLSDLSSSEENLFYPYHEAFAYERIGAAQETTVKEVRFNIADKAKGYPINGVVWNEDRPNVSVRVRVEGNVSLPADRPAVLPEAVDSFIYRNYTIVRDGIVHTRKLPVSLNADTFAKLQANGLLAGEAYEAGKVYVLEFAKTPVINRRMVKGVTAKDTFDKVLQLAVLKGTQKVFNDYRDRVTPKTSKKFLALYGEEATAYLATLGVTDYNGFNPASTTVKSGDYYMAKELKIAAKGLSSLPKVADVENAIKAGKSLKVSEFVMSGAVAKVSAFLDSPFYKDAAAPDQLLATWLETESKACVQRTRELMQELAQCKFAVVVGHTWFSDFTGLDQNSLDVELPGYGKVAVTATLKDIQIEK